MPHLLDFQINRLKKPRMNLLMKAFLLVLFLFVYLNAGAQQAYMVKDLSTITAQSDPRYLAEHDGFVYFFADDGIQGRELWKTDGTASGTALVKDINPGTADGIHYSSDPINSVSMGGILYFIADDGIADNELWRTDGTEAGTYMIKDIGTNWSYNPEYLTDFNGVLYFASMGDLWKSDGTELGTVIVKTDIDPQDLLVVNNTLFMTGYESGTLIELWKSDGTDFGTVMVKDINLSGGSYPANFMAYNGLLYLSANNGVGGNQLWVSDGTLSGTSLVLDDTGNPISNPASMAVSNNTLFIGGMDSNYDGELWICDGTPAGTNRIHSFQSIYGNSPEELTDLNGTLFFLVKDSTVGNFEPLNRSLWTSDGTSQGTAFLKVINSTNPYSNNYFTVYDSIILMQAYDEQNGYELWKTDGSLAGTQLVKNIFPDDGSAYIHSFIPLADQVIFVANDNEHGREIWTTDGTDTGTSMVFDVNSLGDSYINQLTDVNGTLFFSGMTVDQSQELWISDGSDTGTRSVMDIAPHNIIGPEYLTELNGYAYFGAVDSIGYGIFKSDGTASGTELIKQWYVQNMTKVDTMLYGSYPGFWKSDGTEAGTVSITMSAGFNEIISVNGTLYLQSYNAIYKSDGTDTGTLLLKVFDMTYGMATINNTLYFSATYTDTMFNFVSGLWKSDGTVSGTVLVKEMSVSNLTASGGTLFFTGNDIINSSELWKSDGTAAGSVIVKDINPSSGSYPVKLTDINGELYFVADDGTNGFELWKSDGTAMGTIMIKDINSGSGSAFSSLADSIPNFAFLNGEVFFTANDGTTGHELWKTDGTSSGTSLVVDIYGSGSSFPDELTPVDSNLYFTAFDDVYGRELWAYGTPPLPPPPPPVSLEDLESLDLLSIYPNPSAGLINIFYPKRFEEYPFLEIVDFKGSTVYQRKLAKDTSFWQVDLSELPKGIYILKLGNENDTIRKRFVLE